MPRTSDREEERHGLCLSGLPCRLLDERFQVLGLTTGVCCVRVQSQGGLQNWTKDALWAHFELPRAPISRRPSAPQLRFSHGHSESQVQHGEVACRTSCVRVTLPIRNCFSLRFPPQLAEHPSARKSTFSLCLAFAATIPAPACPNRVIAKMASEVLTTIPISSLTRISQGKVRCVFPVISMPGPFSVSPHHLASSSHIDQFQAGPALCM
jgi:hypothetical protein